jgi:DNA-directed RNA polymerase specialized sigma24 family protein
MIALLLRRGEQDSPPLRVQIRTLHDLGLRPAEIAEILGRSSNYVNKELSMVRKEQRKEERR